MSHTVEQICKNCEGVIGGESGRECACGSPEPQSSVESGAHNSKSAQSAQGVHIEREVVGGDKKNCGNQGSFNTHNERHTTILNFSATPIVTVVVVITLAIVVLFLIVFRPFEVKTLPSQVPAALQVPAVSQVPASQESAVSQAPVSQVLPPLTTAQALSAQLKHSLLAVAGVSFKILNHEISKQQFAQFVEANNNFKTDAEKGGDGLGCDVSSPDGISRQVEASWKNTSRKVAAAAVVCVSLQDIEQFVRWLNQGSTIHYRLPTGQEWKIAAQQYPNLMGEGWEWTSDHAIRTRFHGASDYEGLDSDSRYSIAGFRLVSDNYDKSGR